MQIQVQKWGNSLAIRIPKSFATETRLEQGSLLDLTISKGQLVAKPISEPELALEDLLAGVSDENLHGEVETGPAVGKEIW